ncbi:MAG TPA: BamA/TamA family outer membrane protein, partial [Novosphingobium sp.]
APVQIPILDSNGNHVWNVTCQGVLSQISGTGPNGLTQPALPSTCTTAGDAVASTPASNSYPAYREFFLGNTWKPRLAVGIGFNWNSPFGPFRLDFAKTLLKQPGDDPKTFTFNVGTQF